MSYIKIIKDEGNWWQLENRIQNTTLYNSWKWGEYKKKKGWHVVRAAVFDSKSSQYYILIQMQYKRLWGFGPRVFLIQGGPVFGKMESSSIAKCFKYFVNKVGIKNCDIMICQPYQASGEKLYLGLMEAGLHAVSSSAASFTFYVDLRCSELELKSKLTQNWRRNLKRSLKRGLEVRWVPNDRIERQKALLRLSKAYDYLSTRKGFVKAIDIKNFGTVFLDDTRVVMLEIFADGKVIASRVGYICGSVMLDLIAASFEEAKNKYANYLALWSLIQRGKNEGASYFDCGGIDVFNNRGVYLFKKGLSGELFGFVSSWVYVRNPFARCFVKAAFSIR